MDEIIRGKLNPELPGVSKPKLKSLAYPKKLKRKEFQLQAN